MIAEHASGRTGTGSPAADLAEAVRADPDLLAVEFDALIAANYPDLADRPDSRPPRPTARLLIRRLPPTRPSRPVRGELPLAADDRAADDEGVVTRQRSPPGPRRAADRARRR